MRVTTRTSGLGLLSLAFVGFASLGLPDGLLGVAWPGMRRDFGLGHDALGPLLLSFVAGYASSSFASGAVVARIGVGSLLATSALATGASLLVYALSPSWPPIVAAALVAGLGAGGIDAGINTWAALRHSARTLHWLHAFYGLGAALGPMLLVHAVSRGGSWRIGYLEVALVELTLAGAFLLARRRFAVARDGGAEEAAPAAPLRETLALPATRLSIAAFFVYTGIEMAAGVWTYTLYTEARGVEMHAAARWASLFWIGLGAGRVLFGFAISALPGRALIRLALAGIVVASAAIAIDRAAALGGVAIPLLGLACGPIFPSLIAATPLRLGRRHAANGVGLQITAAALGQSLLPAAIGFLAGGIGLEVVGPVLLAAAVALAVIHGRLEDRTAEGTFPRPTGVPE